jgi:hypothetical protein
MIKDMGLASGLLAALLLAGCSASVTSDIQDTDESSTDASSDGFEPVIFENNEDRGESVREFAYNWPAEVSAVPGLVDRFTVERDAALAEQKQEFEDALREFAGSDCLACTNRSYAKDWAVVADLPRFLSLSATIYVYSGGAHGNGTHDDLVWDREAQKAVKAKDFFTSPAALQDALGASWCAALKQERTERLGAEYAEDDFFACPEIAQLNVLLGSSGKQAFDRIGLLAAPYVAGSYAEGGYDATLPITPKVIEAVKPEYKAYFAPSK